MDPRIDCHRVPQPPWVSGAGDLCVSDSECAPTLGCAPIGNDNGLCTRPCADDDECVPSPGFSARCALEPKWGEKACLRSCGSDYECSLGTVCDTPTKVCVQGKAH